MQGHRGKTVSLPETFEIDRTSSSSSAAVDQQCCWNDLRSPPETILPDYILPPNDTFTFTNPNIHEERSWNIGESSSGSAPYMSSNSEWKVESGWPSYICTRQGPRIEDQLYAPNNNVFSLGAINMNPLCPQGSGSSSPALDINLNLDHSSSRGTGGYAREGNSADNRKGKSHEGADIEHMEIPTLHTLNSVFGNSTIPSVSEQINPPRLWLGLTGSASSPIAETSQRNFRLSVNNSSSGQNDLRPQFPTAPAPVSQPPTLPSASHSFEFPRPSALELEAQGQGTLFHAPVPPQPGASIRWARNLVPIDSPAHNEANNAENPLFVLPPPELRTLAQSSSIFPRNVTPALRSSPASAVPQLPQHNPVPHQSLHSRYHRRLLEHARLQGMSFASLGGQSSHSSHPPAFPQEAAALPSGPSNLDHHPPFSRSALRMERQANSVVGIPYSMRSTAPSEGRRRLASEIRSVLEMVRRGEARFEDVMMLDPSMFFGVADIHDRHRDMRLDVDNMSYEELLALGERIGDVGTGLKEDTILDRMKMRKYMNIIATHHVEAAEIEPCCICKENYSDGEGVGTLDCGHDFHRDCIKQWLTRKNLCPICKTTGLAATT